MVSSSRLLPTLNKGVQNDSDDDDEDYEEEMAGYTPIVDPIRAGDDPYPLIDPSESEKYPETKEERAVRLFLEDPERSLKIFFTSYFIDKGLMWQVALFLVLTIYADSTPGRRVDASMPRSSSGSSSHSSSETTSTAMFR